MVALTLHRLVLTSLGMCSCMHIVGCHLVGRGCGMTQSCVLGANRSVSNRVWRQGLMRLAGHTRSLLTHLCEGRVGEHKAMCNVLRLRQVGGQLSPNCMLGFTLGASALKQLLCALVVSQSAAWSSPILIAAMVALTLHRLVLTSLGMCRADRRIVGCHLVGRGCGMTRLCVLGADARFPTEYDGKGHGLTRFAGHMPMVGRHEAICNMPGHCPAGGSQITRSAAIAYACCILLCQFWFVSCFAACSCTKQTDVMSSVTSLAGGAVWRGCLCLGPTLGFQPSMAARCGKGYGLAGHTPKHWPVSSGPCDCWTSRPALHRVAWEVGFLTHNCGTRNSCIHNSFTRNFLTHNLFTLMRKNFKTSSHTTVAHTHTTVSPSYITPF